MNNKIYKPRLTKLILAVLALLSVGVIALGIETSASGAELASTEKEERALIRSNNELAEQIARSTSLTELSQKAQEMGLSKPQNIVYITEEEVVAGLP